MSKVVLNQKAIRSIDAKARTALGLTAEVLRDEVRQEQIVPRDTGALQNEKFGIDRSRLNQGHALLYFEAPYARRLYFHPEYHFQVTKNPNARARWLEPWLRGGKYEKHAQTIFASLLGRLL